MVVAVVVGVLAAALILWVFVRGQSAAGSTTPTIERAKSLGYVAREEFMPPEVEALALRLGPDGFPDARLQRVRDRIVVVTPRGWVNPRSRSAFKAGLHTFKIRGIAYHEAAHVSGNFQPGTGVRLVREPDNPHDANAVAVYAEGATSLAGYVPRGAAPRVARLIDSGADIVAVSVRGAAPGDEGPATDVLVCERGLWEHLTR